MRIIKLNFNSPLHIGEIGIGLEECSPIIHSDTIFNAIINAYSLMHTKDKTDEFLKNFESVKISSAFPFHGKELYFPRPRMRLNADENIIEEHAKEIKKIEFVSKVFFEKLINGEKFSDNEIEKLVKKTKFYKEYQMPKVYLDRETKKSDFFFIGAMKFEKKCGLWFGIECEDNVYKEINSCLRLLQDEGIGGKRTWGYGLFEYEEDNIELRLPVNSNLYMLLSLFYPNQSETALFSGEYASWDFILRGGYIEKRRKPRIRMIKEGSVFDAVPYGKILKFDGFCDYGMAFSVPIRRQNG
jgi:CRISPR-associated protein Csm4